MRSSFKQASPSLSSRVVLAIHETLRGPLKQLGLNLSVTNSSVEASAVDYDESHDEIDQETGEVYMSDFMNDELLSVVTDQEIPGELAVCLAHLTTLNRTHRGEEIREVILDLLLQDGWRRDPHKKGHGGAWVLIRYFDTGTGEFSNYNFNNKSVGSVLIDFILAHANQWMPKRGFDRVLFEETGLTHHDRRGSALDFLNNVSSESYTDGTLGFWFDNSGGWGEFPITTKGVWEMIDAIGYTNQLRSLMSIPLETPKQGSAKQAGTFYDVHIFGIRTNAEVEFSYGREKTRVKFHIGYWLSEFYHGQIPTGMAEAFHKTPRMSILLDYLPDTPYDIRDDVELRTKVCKGLDKLLPEIKKDLRLMFKDPETVQRLPDEVMEALCDPRRKRASIGMPDFLFKKPGDDTQLWFDSVNMGKVSEWLGLVDDQSSDDVISGLLAREGISDVVCDTTGEVLWSYDLALHKLLEGDLDPQAFLEWAAVTDSDDYQMENLSPGDKVLFAKLMDMVAKSGELIKFYRLNPRDEWHAPLDLDEIESAGIKVSDNVKRIWNARKKSFKSSLLKKAMTINELFSGLTEESDVLVDQATLIRKMTQSGVTLENANRVIQIMEREFIISRLGNPDPDDAFTHVIGHKGDDPDVAELDDDVILELNSLLKPSKTASQEDVFTVEKARALLGPEAQALSPFGLEFGEGFHKGHSNLPGGKIQTTIHLAVKGEGDSWGYPSGCFEVHQTGRADQGFIADPGFEISFYLFSEKNVEEIEQSLMPLGWRYQKGNVMDPNEDWQLALTKKIQGSKTASTDFDQRIQGVSRTLGKHYLIPIAVQKVQSGNIAQLGYEGERCGVLDSRLSNSKGGRQAQLTLRLFPISQAATKACEALEDDLIGQGWKLTRSEDKESEFLTLIIRDEPVPKTSAADSEPMDFKLQNKWVREVLRPIFEQGWKSVHEAGSVYSRQITLAKDQLRMQLVINRHEDGKVINLIIWLMAPEPTDFKGESPEESELEDILVEKGWRFKTYNSDVHLSVSQTFL